MERQTVIRFEYDGLVFEEGFCTDLIVEHQVIVELKSVERFAPVHGKTLLTYLRLMNRRVGLLLNFGGSTLTEGLRRVVNDHPPSASPRPPREPSGAETGRAALDSTLLGQPLPGIQPRPFAGIAHRFGCRKA